MILDEMFKFPCVMVDGDNEQTKKNLFSGMTNQPELDIVIGEVECPYFMLIGLKDAWMPSNESFQRAMNDREFEACIATFANLGQTLVPWSKEKFKKEYRKFVEGVKKVAPQMQLITLTDEQLRQIQDEQGSANTEE